MSRIVHRSLRATLPFAVSAKGVLVTDREETVGMSLGNLDLANEVVHPIREKRNQTHVRP